MKLLSRHEFTNSALLETYYLSRADQGRLSVPECDMIGLRRVSADGEDRMTVIRPDEALIMARMLVEAVEKTTEAFEIGLKVFNLAPETFPIPERLLDDA